MSTRPAEDAFVLGRHHDMEETVMKKSWAATGNVLVFVSVPMLAGVSTVCAYDALTRPTELQYWDSSRACNGYTLFGVRGTTYLLDMEGRVVHTWPIGTNPHLLDNGDVLDAVQRRSQRVRRIQGGGLERSNGLAIHREPHDLPSAPRFHPDLQPQA